MQIEIGTIFEGKVTGITKFGAFIDIPGGETGMVHISEVAPTFVSNIRDYIKEGQLVKVRVINISENGKKVALSIKKALEQPIELKKTMFKKFVPNNKVWSGPKYRATATDFEDMMSKFKQTSEERISDLRKVTESKRGGAQRRNPGR